MPEPSQYTEKTSVSFRRVLRLQDLILYGIIVIQPTAPMPVFGVVSQVGRGHVVTAVLIAMVAMLFTAISYGRMARAYPSAGSAYTYVRNEIHPALGYLAGWSIVMDYLLNPLICTIWCSKAAQNFVPWLPYPLLAAAFVTLFTLLNLRGIETSARVNQWLAASMGTVVVLFLAYTVHYLLVQPHLTATDFLRPFYDPKTFSFPAVSAGTAVAVLTYIGFDGVSTLSEEVENPERNVIRATVLTCLITGVLASIEVYAGQLIWPDFRHYPDVDTAFVYIAGRVGGTLLFMLVNLILLVANMGSAFASQLAAARLMFGMGRDNELPRKFFGVLDPVRRVPRNNVLLSGAVALIGALTLSYGLGAELLNFGAFISFMGVNASAFVHYCIRERRRRCTDWMPPIAGFLVCFYIWISLSRPARIVGTIWLCVGLAYWFLRGRLRGGPVFARS
jgi:putrescine importer